VEGFEVKEGSTITAATVSPSTSHLAQLALGWHTARIALSEAAELYAGIVVRVVAKLQNCPMCGRAMIGDSCQSSDESFGAIFRLRNRKDEGSASSESKKRR
jgi:hypothetical protein